ncbi:UDP-glucuronic acid decarboxylase family protein [Candidatus Nucleicultrix amoebiphila]|jgi:UDP-glucuronate decarboxylase|uniref:NAD-dependent dehydratase n=1 Tax=Candidatus Nucleicultrix amoebiphila FS5 TaxID=1414854 RepID=A0A1W6N581_9PROT|nr:UDP-glucuronic acid decarboxylase family protein [Candidatus Nucleicultrix amoebiphila]ARN85040.1 NAD-dependent dehydratase [Candidatus Nucleicultrix amoebiphila FS5]
MFRKRVLITGGAGFIGSHLCRELLKNNCDVLCLDNFFTGKKENVADLIAHPYFELVRHDVIEPYYAEVDEIYNLACPASPIHYQSDPVKTVKTNVLGSVNMLNLALRNKAKILQASTSEIYGDPEIDLQHEEYWGRVNPIGIRSCYDEGKRCAETLFFDYHREHNVNIKVVRIFNTYGPYMRPDDGRVVSNFIVQALKGNDLTVYGDGSQTRSFCYISDLVTGIIKMMSHNDKFTGPINLGNPEPINMLGLADKIIELTGRKLKIVFAPLPSDDPKQRQPDISKARKELNWSATVKLEEGLKETINYFKKIL